MWQVGGGYVDPRWERVQPRTPKDGSTWHCDGGLDAQGPHWFLVAPSSLQDAIRSLLHQTESWISLRKNRLVTRSSPLVDALRNKGTYTTPIQTVVVYTLF
jgi:hypothetical protein